MRAVAIVFAAHAAYAQCPCYTASSTNNTHMCAIEAVPGGNPTVAEWQPIFDAVARGAANGPTIADIPQGCGKPTTKVNVHAQFPCELLKAIAMNESGWKQFCVPTSPADQKGGAERTIISFDCGYGIAQVTSGMHVGEMPAFDRMQVAADAEYNLATGSQILAGKWRSQNCVGDQQPTIIEDWYTATWAYNGLAYSNNPNNPNYAANRPVCDPNQGCPNRPYQERVFGWVEHPPTAAHWNAVALAYPNRADIPDMPGVTQKVPQIPEPTCAGPTDCTNKRSVHVTVCSGVPSPTPTPSPSDLPDLAMALEIDAATADGVDGGHVKMPEGGCDCDVGRSTSSSALGSLAFILLALIALHRASKTR